MLIFNFSYFIGMGWMIMCEILEEYRAEIVRVMEYKPPVSALFQSYIENDRENYFLYQKDMHDKSHTERSIITVYYAFTSLSTVGFGDYVPKNNTERLIASAMLVFGVSIFSYIMSEFVNMIKVIQNFYSDFDEGDNLNKFFVVLEKYNNN